MIKSRFCPSPTGNMHLGNVRTALFNALLALNQKGRFLLRIEDTDQSRSQHEYAASLQLDLQWLGLDWNEGPYWQSQRQAIYNDYYQILQEKGMAYPCFCSEQELALVRKRQLAAKVAPRYPGTCRKLTDNQRHEKIAEGMPHTLRFRVRENYVIEFDDLVRGSQRFQSDDLGDFIIRRADGTASFLFCNALDDALMGVTHALRGEDHLTNTPRQILLLQALNLFSPHYGHIALIMGSDGSPLSKRHGSRSIKELREMGYLPMAINNYLARLGHYYAENHFMDLNELAAKFSLQALGAAPAHFDAQQLDYWQKEAIVHLNDADFWQWLPRQTQSLVPENKKAAFIRAIKHNIFFSSDSLNWAKIFFADLDDFIPEAWESLAAIPQGFFQQAKIILTATDGNPTNKLKALGEKTGIQGKGLYQTLRLTLTGVTHGPEMAYILELVDKDRIEQRINKVLNRISMLQSAGAIK